MKFKIQDRFEGGPFDEVVHYLTEEYVFEPANLPNVKGNKLLKEVLTEDTKYCKYEWCAHGQIPKVVQHILKPQMLTWIEETTLDRKAKVFKTKITPFYFKSVVSCESTLYFVKKSDDELVRITDGFLNIRIPIFGIIIEEVIIAYLKQNFAAEHKVTFKFIKEKFGKK